VLNKYHPPFVDTHNTTWKTTLHFGWWSSNVPAKNGRWHENI